jgi:hypothetical protein
MSTFTFSPFNTANLATGTFYAHLVTTIPNISNTVVSDLVLCAVGGYVPVVLTGVSLNSTRWTANNITFPIYNFTSPIIGVVICKQIGASPASTDPILAYSDLSNSLNQSITSGTGNVNILVEVTTNGFVSYTDNFIYASGSNPADQVVPFGSIYMLATSNNTLAYVNPITSAKIVSSHEAGSNSNGFDRSLISPSTPRQFYVFDFTRFTVKVGDFNIFSMSTTTNVTLWGSNSPSALTTAFVSNTGWTSLASSTGLAASAWTTLTSSNGTYWKYLRLASNTADIALQEIELYNSFILSPTLNMV